MISRLRSFCRDESLGIVIPIGVVVLLAFWSVLQGVGAAFVTPILEEAFGDSDEFGGSQLDFTVGDIVFDWTFLGFQLPAFVILCGIVYILFIRPIPDDEIVDDESMRACPECASEIVAEARRCPFCTAVIEPLAGSAESAT
jgi:large conductance mechanosensitive channel